MNTRLCHDNQFAAKNCSRQFFPFFLDPVMDQVCVTFSGEDVFGSGGQIPDITSLQSPSS